MKQNLPKVALIYDFDKTLSPKDMQAFGYMDQLDVAEDEFWKRCQYACKVNSMDRILGYMYVMLKSYKEKGLKLTRDFLVDCGKKIELYNGVDTWFDRINNFGKSVGVEIEHYVVSSGLKEMVEGTSIAKYFKEIYAGYFIYENGEAVWPAMAINYTNKTQYIYRINKGILNVNDESINDSMSHDIRPVPFTNMVYIGDSATDIPCMRLVMKSGGYSIGVYQEQSNHNYLKDLIMNNRINYIVPADYSENSDIENVVKEIIESVKHTENLKALNRKQKQNLSWKPFNSVIQ